MNRGRAAHQCSHEFDGICFCFVSALHAELSPFVSSFFCLISIVHAGQSQFCQQGFCVLFLYCIHLSAGSFVLYCMQSYLHLSTGILCFIFVLHPFVSREFCLVLHAELSPFVSRDFLSYFSTVWRTISICWQGFLSYFSTATASSAISICLQGFLSYFSAASSAISICQQGILSYFSAASSAISICQQGILSYFSTACMQSNLNFVNREFLSYLILIFLITFDFESPWLIWLPQLTGVKGQLSIYPFVSRDFCLILILHAELSPFHCQQGILSYFSSACRAISICQQGILSYFSTACGAISILSTGNFLTPGRRDPQTGILLRMHALEILTWQLACLYMQKKIIIVGLKWLTGWFDCSFVSWLLTRMNNSRVGLCR